MPGGGFHEQVVQAVINVRDDLRASFCERFDGFHVLFGQYLQVFCPIGGPYGALHPFQVVARVILYDAGYFRTYGLSGEQAGIASADAVREVSR